MNQQTLQKAANFGDLVLNLGTNMEIDLQVIQIGQIKRVGKNNTPCQKCELLDQNGYQEEVTVWMGRTSTALADINLNQWLTFNLSASKYRGKDQYSGFWQMEVNTQAPQNVPKTPQKPLQATNTIQMPDTYAYPLTPESQARVARSVGVEAAGRIVATMIGKGHYDDGGSLTEAKNDMLDVAETMAMYIDKGIMQSPETLPPDHNNMDAEGHPF